MCRGRSYLTWSPTPRSGNPWTGNPDLPLPCASLNAAKAHGGGTAWNWPGILWEQPGKAESFAAKTMETETVTRTNFMSEFCFANETSRIWAFSGDFSSNPQLSPLFPTRPLIDFSSIGAYYDILRLPTRTRQAPTLRHGPHI